ncbi:hypothetical protein LBMAG49_01110 [Planctomycetota bacterium]|nr:hypothetical protein LBMAG49_01110 [Planctomycetota bacterium]
MHSTGLPITTTNGNPNEGMPMSIYKQQFQTDLRAKMPPQDEVADHDPSVGGLAAALGNREPLDDAEAILAENLAAEGNAEVADESDPSATEQTELFSPQKSSLLARLLGLMAKTLGAVSLIGSGVLTITPTGPLATAFGASLGMTAGNWYTISAVLLVAGVLHRQMSRLTAMSRQQETAQQHIQSHMQHMLDQEARAAERPPAEGEELERVLVALERQDEKINNLTKALKMYGKPLMEIANSSADVTSQLAGVKSQTENLRDTLKTELQQLLNSSNSSDELGDAVGKRLDALSEKLSPHALQQQIARLEASIQAISLRLEDSEVRKSLVRLEDADKVQARKLENLTHTEAMQKDLGKIEHQLDLGLGKLSNALEQVRSGNLGAIETTVRDMQRELAGLATSMANVQQAVRTGGNQKAAAAQPAMVYAAADSHVASNATAADSAKKQPAPAVESAVDTKGMNDAQVGAAQNQTGSRASSGKNVLGAIAKLKKLKA